MEKLQIVLFFTFPILIFFIFRAEISNAESSAIDYENKHDNPIIADASYVVYDKDLKNKTFYTYDGNPIIKIKNKAPNLRTKDYTHPLSTRNRRLDPEAPKPQPIYYTIEYYRAFKGRSGYRIYFLDKNDNEIKWYRYNKKLQAIQISNEGIYNKDDKLIDFYKLPRNHDLEPLKNFPLDLSIVQEKKQSMLSRINDIMRDYVTNPMLKFLNGFIYKKPKKSSVKKNIYYILTSRIISSVFTEFF